MKHMLDLEPRELGIELVGILGRGIAILIAEAADHRTLEPSQLIEWRFPLAPGFEHAGRIAGDRAGEIRQRAGGHEQDMPAHAMAGDGEPIMRDVRAGLEVGQRGADVGDDLGVLEVAQLANEVGVGSE